MLKKRILASSMASVMALSSVSVVAFAEETKDYGESVTKAELQAFVDGEVDFIADELPTYGSKQGEKYQAAYDHAVKVLDDEKSVAADYTAAYQMVKAVKAELQVYTADQLQALINENKSKYDKNNEFNEELQDNIYTEDTFTKFTSAYDDATRYVDSDDSLLITDAYIALEDAVKKLSELKTVTKSDFRTALRAYEELQYKMNDYETWRRGTLTVKSTTGTAKASGDIVSKKPAIEFGELIDIVYNTSDTITPSYWDKTKWKTLDPTVVSDDDAADHAGDGRWIGGYEIAVGADLSTVINDAYKELDEVKGATITSKPEIVAAYEAAVDAVAVFNGWKADSYKTGSKGSIATLISKYRPQLVETFNQADIDDFVAEIHYTENPNGTDSTGWYVDASDNNTVKEGGVGTLKDAKDSAYTLKHDAKAHTLKCNKALYIIKDKATGLMYNGGSIEDYIFSDKAKADAKIATDTLDTDDYEAQKISAGTNIFGYMEYTADDTQADATFDAVVAAKTGDAKYISSPTAGVEADPAKGPNGNGTITIDSATYTYYKKSSTGSAADETAAKDHNKLVDAIVSAWATYEAAAAEAANFAAVEADYETYKSYKFDDTDRDTALALINGYTTGGKTIAKASGSTTEWTLIWRKMAYTLEDMFPVKVEDKYTLADLKKMIDRAYDACEATGDSSLFAKYHMNLVNERQFALDWYAAAKATTGYKTDDTVNGTTLAVVYKGLKDDVEALEKWLKDFKYSYGQIKADIAKVADAIDKGDVKGTDELKKALAKVAYDLSVLQPSDVFSDGDAEEVNLAFDSERIFQAPNRLKTAKNKAKAKPNDYEKALLTSYEALLKAYDEAKNGGASESTDPQVKYNFDGKDGFTLEDVVFALDEYLAGSTDKKYDIDGNGTVELDDIVKLLDTFLAL